MAVPFMLNHTTSYFVKANSNFHAWSLLAVGFQFSKILRATQSSFCNTLLIYGYKAYNKCIDLIVVKYYLDPN